MNIVDFNKFKDSKELEKFAQIQFDNVIKLKQEVEELKLKLKHAENLLTSAPSVLTVGTPEEEICKIEIQRLYTQAKVQPLEFEQVKIFDIYVKSLLSIKGKPVEKSKKPSSTLSQEELLKLALEATDDSSEQ